MRRRCALVLICIALAAGSAARAERRARAPRLGILVTAGPRVGVPLVAGVSGDLGWVLRPDDARFEDGRRSAFFGQPGGNVLWRGRKWSFSAEEELRGREEAWGPIGRGDPARGDRIDVPLIPGIAGLSVSRKGGFGVNFGWIPIPGTPYPFVRGSATIYVVHPRLAPLSGKTLDAVDWVTARVIRPIVNSYRRVRPRRSR